MDHWCTLTPYFLMFGCHPSIPVDLVLGRQQEAVTRSVDSYVATLHQRLQETTPVSRDSQAGQKKGYDHKVRSTILFEGDRGVVRVTGLKGSHKLADRWSEEVYTVLKQPNQDIPVYEVKPEVGKGRLKVLNWNMLLLKIDKKEKDIHLVPIDVSHTESVGSGTDSSISDASDIPDLQMPIPAPRRILRNVPAATPRLSNVVPLDMSDSSDNVLSLGNDGISAGSERSISDISDTEVGNVDTESVSENISEYSSEGNNSGIEFSEGPAEVSADGVENSNSCIEFSEEPAEVSADIIENLGTDSEVWEVSSNFTPTPVPRR